jgi:hypothetical protein
MGGSGLAETVWSARDRCDDTAARVATDAVTVLLPFARACTTASIARSRVPGGAVRVLVVGAPFPRRRGEFIATLRIP